MKSSALLGIGAGLAIATGLVCAFVFQQFNSTSRATLAGFNPENIISDANFTDYKSMSAAQIQTFLNQKNSVCLRNFQTLSLNDRDGNGLGDEPYGKGVNHKVSAATLIWQAAQIYKINPKVILVTLQKEQGLVTRTDCPAWRYNTALGYGCPDSAPCDTTAYGLTRQIDYGVWHFRGFFDDSYPIPPTVPGTKAIAYNPDGRCGSKTITIRNRATAALYSYTPYQPNAYAMSGGSSSAYPNCGAFGNRNFYDYYTDWFGPSTSSSDALFVRCSDNNTYLIESNQGRKRLISPAMRAAWGITDSDILDIGYGCNLSTYSLDMDNVVRIRSSGNVYLVDNGKAYRLTSATANAWGLGNVASDTYPQVESETLLSYLRKYNSLPRIATSTNPANTSSYLIDSGKRYLIKGTNIGETNSFRLVTGDTINPQGEFSVSLLSPMNLDPAPIDFSFTIGSNLYITDFYSARKVTLASKPTWDTIDGIAPALSSNVLSAFNLGTIDDSFERAGTHYKILANGSYNQTPDKSIANNWSGAYPSVTRLLTNKVTSSSSLNLNISSLPGNIRLITCNGQKYIIERFKPIKRLVSEETANHWGFNNYYWFNGDRGCNYPTYSAALNDHLIRSRNTKKVYYVHQGNAYLVDNTSALKWNFGNITTNTYPMFDPPSILDNLSVVRQLPDSL